jgi:hypothetical protein
LFQLNIKGSTFSENMDKATFLVGRFQERAKASVGTTADMVAMASALAQPLSAVGATLQQNEDIVVATVVASKAMGIAAEVAARDIDQAMRGQFHSVDQFSSKILAPLGFVGEQGRSKFNAMGASARFQAINQALGQKAIADMARAQETSFSGVFSTLQDNIQIAIGKVGLPLFKQITAEIRSWNQWIEQNGETLAKYGSSIGRGLTEVFSAIRAAASFFVAHGSTVLAIAKAFAVLQLTKMVGGGIGGAFGGLTGLSKGLREMSGVVSGPAGLVSGFGGLVTKVNAAAGAMAGLFAASMAFGDWLGGRIMDNRNAEALGNFTVPQTLKDLRQLRQMAASGYDPKNPDLPSTDPWFDNLDRDKFMETRQRFMERLSKAGLANESGQLDRSLFAKSLDQNADLKREAAMMGGLLFPRKDKTLEGHIAAAIDSELIANALAHMIDKIAAINGGPSKVDSKAPSSDKPKINVTIQHIEVAADDPDRFVIGMVKSFRRVAANPGQARRVLREGL